MTETDPTPAEMLTEMAAMRAELARLRSELAELTGKQTTNDELVAEPAEFEVTSRRRLFALAGGAAAAAVAATAIGSSRPAAAANGANINIAENVVSSAGKVISTFVNYSPATSNVDNRNMFVVGDAAAAFNPDADKTAAVSGYAANRANIGVSGYSTVPGGKGVYGESATGVGVHAVSGSGWDLLLGGTGRLYISESAVSGPPTGGSYSTGELARDAGANFWVCTGGGVNATWKKLATVEASTPVVLPPQLHVIEPTRVYDSRLPNFGGRISDGQSRSLSVANGIDINSGAVTAVDVVPAGAAAIQFTFTIDAAQNNGFLAVTPGDSATFKASTINWSPTTPNIASGSLCKLAADRTLKVYAGGGGSTHFIVDITGYYL